MYTKTSILLGLLTTLTLIVTVAPPVSAASTPESRLSAEINQAYEEFSELRPYISADNQQFDADAALAAGMDETLVEQTLLGWSLVESPVVALTAQKSNPSRDLAAVAAAAACAGVTKQVGWGWGAEYWHDNCSVNVALAAAAGTISVAAAVAHFAKGWGAAAAAVLLGVMGLGASIAAGCNSAGRGIVITSYINFSTCRSQ